MERGPQLKNFLVRKTFEKLVNNKLTDPLKKIGLSSSFQYGSRSSCLIADLWRVVSYRIAINKSSFSPTVALINPRQSGEVCISWCSWHTEGITERGNHPQISNIQLYYRISWYFKQNWLYRSNYTQIYGWVWIELSLFVCLFVVFLNRWKKLVFTYYKIT